MSVCESVWWSPDFSVTSGVPQDGYLSPLLWFLFVNNLCQVLKYYKFLYFPDDIQLSLKINSLDDCEKLQNNLHNFVEWVKLIGLLLSVKSWWPQDVSQLFIGLAIFIYLALSYLVFMTLLMILVLILLNVLILVHILKLHVVKS